MTRRVTVVCDTCGTEIEYSYKVVEHITLKEPSTVLGAYFPPQEQATYCSFECLGKAMAPWAKRYDMMKEKRQK